MINGVRLFWSTESKGPFCYTLKRRDIHFLSSGFFCRSITSSLCKIPVFSLTLSVISLMFHDNTQRSLTSLNYIYAPIVQLANCFTLAATHSIISACQTVSTTYFCLGKMQHIKTSQASISSSLEFFLELTPCWLHKEFYAQFTGLLSIKYS